MDKHYRKDVFLGNAYFNKNLFLQGVQVFGVQSKIYFVDGNNGDDENDGLSWANAKKTITAAITAHTAYRATRAGESVDTYIIIAPATYAENIETLPFSCTMVGLGVLGTDKATEIHPAAGPCIAGTVSGLKMYNISFQSGTGAVDTIDFNICNNVHIIGCEFYPGATNSKAAISTQNCGMSVFRGNRILTQSAWKYTHGFYFGGGADKYCIVNLIEDNIIGGLAATGVGIFKEGNCAGEETIVRNNIIRIPGDGIGIDDNSDTLICIGNKIFHVGGTALDINAAKAAMNICNDNGAVTCYPEINFGAQS